MEDKAKQKNRIFAIVKFVVLIAVVVGIPLYIYVFHKDMITSFRSLDDAAAFLRQYKQYSIPVYLIAEVLQILISILPGQLFQMAAGYLFGFVPGVLLTLLGAIVGTVITFYLARVLGSDAVHMMLGEDRSKHYMEILNSRRAYLITFILYMIPGLPKDTICYVAGVSDIRLIPFLVISVAGRMPAMAASVAFGALYMKHDYTGMAIVGVLVAIICLICIIKRKDIMSFVDRMYEKYSA